ncbi:MAG: response regulator [Candidatus Moranbacteria bacterium]|nr:response regulator [Candidatus Moranbacteria bacterium]
MKILILEDDEMIADIYKKHFEQAGNEVILVNETQKALERIMKEKPEVALLDLLISGGGGIEILKKLKDWGGKTKLIIFSNEQDPEKEKETKNLGAADFLIKADYTPEKLLKKLGG